jgi:signal transduction histidine kinase
MEPLPDSLILGAGAGPDWQAIVDQIDVAIVVFDANDRLVAWNRAFAETAGPPAIHLEPNMEHLDILTALAERGVYGPGDPRALAEQRQQELFAKRREGREQEFTLANGLTYIRDIYRTDAGETIAVTRHFERHKTIEQELAAKSAILQTVFETLNQPICVWDGSQRLVACNDKFAELTGLEPHEIAPGMHTRDFILAAARKGFLGSGDPVALAEARYDEMWTDHPASQETVQRSGRVYDTHRGNLPDGGVVSIFNDVTERVQAAEELREAKAQAENASAVKSDFLANMSHELRTPLNAIMGFSEMMIHTRFDDPAQYQEYAGDIRNSAVLLLNIINDLLDLSRIEAGKTEFRLITVDLHDCVSTCIELIQRTDGAQRLSIENRVPEDFPQVQSDESFLRQALLNLLSNAVKATPDGGRIVVAADLSGQGRFTLTVTDTGVGMPPEMIETVFNPYDGGGNSYVRKEKGTGLGLSIVKRLIEMLNGTVAIESAPDQGTTVRLDLPVSFTD